MKTLALITILIYSLSLSAQLRTTGGGGPNPEEIDIFDRETSVTKVWPVINKIPIPFVTSFTSTQNKFTVLTYKLLKLEAKCGLRKSVKWNHNVMDSYYNIRLKEFSQPKFEKECAPVRECVSDKELKSIVKNINQDPNTFVYMKAVYNLDQKEAEEVLKYFQSK